MNCPNCGVDVVEEAGFCHKCGGRIDMTQEQFPPYNQGEDVPVRENAAPEIAAAEHRPNEAAAEPAPSPLEQFKAAAAGTAVDAEPERDLWQGGYCSKAMIGAWALSGLITIVLVVLAIWIARAWFSWTAVIVILLLWLYQLLKLCYRRMNVRYRLTSQRFIHETGILRRVTDRIEVIDMDDIAFEQSFLERFVGVGTIRITSSDRTHPELTLVGIEDVKTVSAIVDDIRRSERRRRGLHIESI